MWKDYRKNSRRNNLQTAGGKYSDPSTFLIIQIAISFAENCFHCFHFTETESSLLVLQEIPELSTIKENTEDLDETLEQRRSCPTLVENPCYGHVFKVRNKSNPGSEDEDETYV